MRSGGAGVAHNQGFSIQLVYFNTSKFEKTKQIATIAVPILTVDYYVWCCLGRKSYIVFKPALRWLRASSQ